MKKCLCLVKLIFLALIFVLGFMTNVFAATVSDNKSTEFMLAFMENIPSESSPIQNLFITGDSVATGTVEIPGISPPFFAPFSITPGSATQISIPSGALLSGSDLVSKKGIRIAANTEIAIYGFNRPAFSSDAFLGLPVDTLGTEYIVLGRNESVSARGASPTIAPSEFVVVGVTDGTTVTVAPSISTGVRIAGNPFNILMDRFDTYQLQSDGALEDLSGTIITSDKPIVVFAGGSCIDVPNGVAACDHLVEQLPPTATYGKDFLTVSLANRTAGDLFRIMARDDGTEVKIDGALVATINRAKFHEVDLPSGTTHMIQTTKPALVMQYAKGGNADGMTGDPFMMMIQPTTQFLSNYIVSTPATSPASFSNFINIVVPTTDINSCTIDGVPLTATFSSIGTSGFSGAQVSVSNGTHTISCSKAFGLYVYGFASFDSYGYPGGLALEGQGLALSPIPTSAPIIKKLTLPTTEAQTGDTVDIKVDLSSLQNKAIASLQVDIDFDEKLLTATGAVQGAAAIASGKGVNFTTLQGGKARLVIIGQNQSAIPDGNVAIITFKVAENASVQSTILSVQNLSAADANGDSVGISGQNGSISIFTGIELSIKRVTGGPGTTINSNIVLKTTKNISGLQFDLVFDDTRFSIPNITAGGAATSANKNVSFNKVSPGKTRILIVGNNNQNVIGDGVVAIAGINTIKVAISSGVSIVNATATDANGKSLGVSVSTFSGTKLEIGNGSGPQEGFADVSVDLTTSDKVSQLQFDVEFDSSALSFSSVSAGSVASGAGKGVSSSVVSANTVRVIVSGVNKDLLGDGPVAVMRFNIAGNAAIQRSVLKLKNVTASTPDAASVSVNTDDGEISVTAKVAQPSTSDDSTPIPAATATPNPVSGGGGGGGGGSTPTPAPVDGSTPTPAPATTLTPVPTLIPVTTPFPTATVTPTATPGQTPVADFFGNPTEGKPPLNVQFTDNSTGLVDTWSWDFGDGSAGAEQNPEHTYDEVGTFTVSLTVTGSGGSNTAIKPDFIKIVEGEKLLLADFIATPVEGEFPLDVQFTDFSSGEIIAWNWDFGDGNISVEQDPLHTYIEPGIFSVTLTIASSEGSATERNVDFINVTESGAPVADFSVVSTTGFVPLEAQFINLSKGVIDSFNWDFGDGDAGIEVNPSHTYNQAGIFTVSLTVEGPGGISTDKMENFIQVLPEGDLIAEFTGVPLIGETPLSVRFNDISTGEIVSRLWDFGDGNVSQVPDPSNLYDLPGFYTVSLTVSGSSGSITKSKTDFVQVFPKNVPITEFTAVERAGFAPFEVQFNDISAGTVESWSWDFGDGSTSDEQNPVHSYLKDGVFAVKLITAGPGGTNSKVKEQFIRVLPINSPQSNFKAEATSGFNPFGVQFFDLSGGDINSWLWNFGDGGVSEEQNPFHVYEKAGVFTVSLAVSGNGGDDIEVKTDLINVISKGVPIAEFGAISLASFAPFIVQFTDFSSGEIDSYVWEFGDGGTSTEQSPVHTYNKPGFFTVKLTVSGPTGASFEQKLNFIVAFDEGPPVTEFSATPTVDFNPFVARFTDLSEGLDITSFTWNFGDGGISTEQNPFHEYKTIGAFTVSLITSNSSGASSERKINIMNSVPAGFPISAFSASPSAAAFSGANIQFNDLSEGDNITSWLWNFGDGGVSTEQNPVHIYSFAGHFTVSLVVSGGLGTDVETKANFIRVVPAGGIISGFSVDKSVGKAPLSVQFKDLSEGQEPTSFFWDFGDGSTSIEQDPNHTYNRPGIFTVSLTSSGKNAADTEKKINIINILPEDAPEANFSVNQTDGIVPFEVEFTDLSTGDIASWLWIFGDGATSVEQNPSHTYNVEGIFTVSLTVSGPLGANIETKTNLIRVENILASVEIEPGTIVLGSRGRFTARIRLPFRFNETGIKCNSIVCEGAQARFCRLEREFGGISLLAKFNIKDLDVEPGDDVEFTVTGNLKARKGQLAFKGTDIVNVLPPSGR